MGLDDYPYICSVDFQLSVPALPWYEYDPDFYVQEITGTVRAMISDTEEVQAGTIKVLKVNVSQAANDRVPLFDVCDAHSDFLAALYGALFENELETKPELEIEPCWNELLVLWEFDMPTQFRDADGVVCAFETAIATFGAMDLVAAAMEGESYRRFVGLDLAVDEWRRLGFKRIAGTQFAFRDSCRKNPYDAQQDQD